MFKVFACGFPKCIKTILPLIGHLTNEALTVSVSGKNTRQLLLIKTEMLRYLTKVYGCVV